MKRVKFKISYFFISKHNFPKYSPIPSQRIYTGAKTHGKIASDDI
jgi:hypothetical protein